MEKARKELEGMGGKVFAYFCDVSDNARVKELSVQAVKDMGRVDILVNNAACVRAGKFLDIPVEDSTKQIDINVNSILYTTHALLPGMMERNSGHIVNVSSGVAMASAPGLAAYTTSKWAVWGLREVLRVEGMAEGKTGVKFTSVHPGAIVTGMFEGFSLNWFGRLIIRPVKDHDIIAKGIVESGLKRNVYVVCRPRAIYSAVMLRGLLPNSLNARFLLMFGMGDCAKNYKGRKGFIHSDPKAE
jgi:NAD(P)-dependent dehydrogenase (short-subunit alcohol dehydrogenase family)